MIGTLHALGILFTVVAALGCAIRWPARPTWRRGLASALVVVLGVMVGLLSLHGCDAGSPLTQWLVPTLAAVAAVLFCGARRPRVVVVAASVGVAVALSLHFNVAVHGPAWIGNPDARSLEGAGVFAEWHTPLTGLWRR
ncbi:MAG: hypothetical protein KF901_12260 [Myxococcales bacterium]|nr:hypothetical protein [Myxococcales bacterium]